MESPSCEQEYLSIGGNRQTAAADWHTSGILAFGADVNITLWKPDDHQSRGISALLAGHKSQVKAVAFLPTEEGEHRCLLVTGADDHSLKLWSICRDDLSASSCLQTVEAHAGAITFITAVAITGKPGQSPSVIVASGAADAIIKIWAVQSDALALQQTIKTNPKFFPLAIALSLLDEGRVVVLAAAGTRETIQIHATNVTAGKVGEFTLQATLSGHQGWIRWLDFSREHSAASQGDVLLASASQDKYIRLWRLHAGRGIPVAPASRPDPSIGAALPGRLLSNKTHSIKVGGQDCAVTFEALLLGHEDWVYSARWHRQVDGTLQLLSSSADNSLAIWESDPASGIWITTSRLGELSREKGATTATGSVGGFWTGLWSPDGSSVVCLGRTGSWRRWRHDRQQDQWFQAAAITGHTKAVTGISWSRDGVYLLSTSSDQTTRLHAQWRRETLDAATTTTTTTTTTWHEMARPQIHGYDLNCIDSLGQAMFVSGADEKLMRVFREPGTVARLIGRLTGVTDTSLDADTLPNAADMPVLGLSNKSVPGSTAAEAGNGGGPNMPLDHPPFEDTLSRATLWPEVEKLYGHGYEIACLAASHDGALVASACRASSLNHAVIRLFETQRWTELKPPLAAHTLTATRLRWSADDRLLLSVGRDRQWAVFERTAPALQDGGPGLVLRQSNAKGHARMILDAAWAPLAPSQRRVFATAGRDKAVKFWASSSVAEDAQSGLAHTMSYSEPVTALDFLPRLLPSSSNDAAPTTTLLAVGTESGVLQLLSIDFTGEDVKVIFTHTLTQRLCLPKAVLQLAWRPDAAGEEQQGAAPSTAASGKATLAVAGEDSSLRIYDFANV